MASLEAFKPCKELGDHYRALYSAVEKHGVFPPRTALANVITLYHLGPIFAKIQDGYDKDNPKEAPYRQVLVVLYKLIQTTASNVETKGDSEQKIENNALLHVAKQYAPSGVEPFNQLLDNCLAGDKEKQ
jgi:hypothetical protein